MPWIKIELIPRPQKFGKIHNCSRKMAIILHNNKFPVFESQLCVSKGNLSPKELSSYNFCFKNIHKLPYYPKTDLKCKEIEKIVKHFLQEHKICIVFYKGGVLERNFCEKIGYECINLATFGDRKAKSHCLLSEVRFYNQELEKLSY